jgi:hypothetical protein
MQVRRSSVSWFFLFLLVIPVAHFVTETSFSQKGKIATVAEKCDQALSLYRQNRIEESMRLISTGLGVDPNRLRYTTSPGGVITQNAGTLTGLGWGKMNREEAQEAPDCCREALKI